MQIGKFPAFRLLDFFKHFSVQEYIDHINKQTNKQTKHFARLLFQISAIRFLHPLNTFITNVTFFFCNNSFGLTIIIGRLLAKPFIIKN